MSDQQGNPKRGETPDNQGRRSEPAENREQPVEARQEHLPEPPIETRRSARDSVPGIPAGSGAGSGDPLETPDSDLGGVVAGDTTPGGPTGDEPDERQVHEDDRKRNTL